MLQLAQQGKIINSDFPAKTSNIADVKQAWGEPDDTEDYVAAAKGTYATYLSHNVVLGFNKGGQIFEVRSYDSQLKNISLTKIKEVFGYETGSEYKIVMVFFPVTESNPDGYPLVTLTTTGLVPCDQPFLGPSPTSYAHSSVFNVPGGSCFIGAPASIAL